MKWGVIIMIGAFVLALLTPLLYAITVVTNNVLIGYATIASLVFVLPVAAGLFLVGLMVFLAPVSRENNVVEQSDSQLSR